MSTRINVRGYTLKNLNKINILLGKNGCGKSTLLREVEQELSSQSPDHSKIKYITPERGGTLIYDPNVEQNLVANPAWLSSMRRRNQTTSFRQQSTVQYRKLETLVLREIEKDKRNDSGYTFDLYVDKINSLLDNIEIKRLDTTFKIYKKGTTSELGAEPISSGESELISLGIECLVFNKECITGKGNFLFLDEPDVHLHPDLQMRLMHFLRNLVSENNFKVLIATHSTAILGGLESFADTHLAFMPFGQKEIEFKAISDVYKKVLPVFGAHPLSNVFNEAPVLLVEGEDDERIWQQAVRTSNGKIKIYPCSCDGISEIDKFEVEVKDIINSVYDNARAYSLRDGGAINGEINDLRSLIRLKLNCYSAENLLLCNEVLGSLFIRWDDLKIRIDDWLTKNTTHTHYATMNKFKEGNYDRQRFDLLKEIRNDLMGIIGSSKPWEVAIGQVIGNLTWNDDTVFSKEGSIYNLLGEKLIKSIIPKQQKDGSKT